MSKSVDKIAGVWYYTWAPSAETKEWLLKSQQEALEKNQWTFKSFAVAKAMNRPSGAFKQTERSCESKMEGSHPDKLTVSTEKLLNDLSSKNFKSFSKSAWQKTASVVKWSSRQPLRLRRTGPWKLNNIERTCNGTYFHVGRTCKTIPNKSNSHRTQAIACWAKTRFNTFKW